MNAPIERLTGRDLYIANRARFKPEELVPYYGKWAAWSKEGDRVVVCHEDPVELVRMLKELGVSTDDVICDRIPEDGEPEGIL